jgi:hypothetical protein
MADKFTSVAIIVDRYGKEHKVFPAKLKWKDEIRRLSPKFDDTLILANYLNVKRDEEGKPVEDLIEGEIEFDDEALDAMFEVLVLAFDNKYTKEQIEEFMDLELARQAFEVFWNISNLKKKMKQENTKD